MREKLSSVVVIVVSLGKSACDVQSSQPLRMINSENASRKLKANTLLPSRMVVSSGKSIHHSHSVDPLSNTARRQKKKWNFSSLDITRVLLQDLSYSVSVSLSFRFLYNESSE